MESASRQLHCTCAMSVNSIARSPNIPQWIEPDAAWIIPVRIRWAPLCCLAGAVAVHSQCVWVYSAVLVSAQV